MENYWEETRRPLPSLVFLLPLLIYYEIGIVWIGDYNATVLRNGADAWLRWILGQANLPPAFVLPICLVAIFVVWQFWTKEAWKCEGEVLLGMFGESLALALGLMVVGRVQDLAFQQLESQHQAVTAAWRWWGEPSQLSVDLIAYVGAGIYEETLFRLMVIPTGYYLMRLLGVPSVICTTIILSLSAILFASAHYVGPTAEQFVWFSFIFRWVAGLFFGAVFVLRGFGVAVGTHAAYDVLVGVLGFQL